MNKEILHCAIGLLSRREHSQKELAQKLLKKQFIADDIPEVIDYLLANNYLSDERFSESVFRTRINKGYGWLYIKNELKQKGVSSQIINQLHKNAEIDWYLQAELAYNKRFDGFSLDIDEGVDFSDFSQKEKHYKNILKEKAKRMRFLQSRGYSPEQIMSVLNVLAM